MTASGLQEKLSIKHFGVLLAERGRMVSVLPMQLLGDSTRSKRDDPGACRLLFRLSPSRTAGNARCPLPPAARRFPPPWTIGEHAESFIVKDLAGLEK